MLHVTAGRNKIKELTAQMNSQIPQWVGRTNSNTKKGGSMFKKILITTDGSPLSNSVALAGVAFARQLQAEVIGIFVAPEYQYPIYIEIAPPAYPSEEEYRSSMCQAGANHLKIIADAAESNGLPFSGLTSFSDSAAQKIVEAAEQNHCDLIYIGSHGRGGWGQLLLGSVTNKVLSSCQIPVLVHRLKQNPHITEITLST
jgi:nucleotide-binding universal stress UspA family protein